MAIDPTKITKFDCNDYELEERIIFWILASGKNGVTTAFCLEDLLSSWWLIALGNLHLSPFEILEQIDSQDILAEELKRFGFGCYRRKAEYLKDLIYSGINLRICSVEELEKIKGIGKKTARCYLIHSRRNQKYAGLDTHCLKFLRDMGHDVPKSTPTGKKYLELEKIFLQYVEESGKTVAELDLEIWNRYRGKNGKKT